MEHRPLLRREKLGNADEVWGGVKHGCSTSAWGAVLPFPPLGLIFFLAFNFPRIVSFTCFWSHELLNPQEESYLKKSQSGRDRLQREVKEVRQVAKEHYLGLFFNFTAVEMETQSPHFSSKQGLICCFKQRGSTPDY